MISWHGFSIKVIGAGLDARYAARAMIAMLYWLKCQKKLTLWSFSWMILRWGCIFKRFHARYKAAGKTYQYTIFDGRLNRCSIVSTILHWIGTGHRCDGGGSKLIKG